MAVYIGPVSKQAHEAAIEFLFGSVENYRNSPELKHVISRAQECEDLINGIERFYDEAYKKVSWFFPYRKLQIHFSRQIVGRVLCGNLRHMKVCYLAQRGLPAKVIIRHIDTQFDEVIAPYKKLIEAVREKYLDDNTSAE